MSSPALPKSYICYRFEKTGGMPMRAEVPWVDPQEREVIIKVLACGVCGSDYVVQAGNSGSTWPRTPGHEVVGDIVAVHPSVTQWKVGQRVGVPWKGGYCGECNKCRAGLFTACEKMSTFTTGGTREGGYAQYCAVRIEGLAAIPEDLDPAEVAPMMCAGVTVYKSILSLNTHPGSIVAVKGIGGLGHLAIQFYRAMGYYTIAISSSSAKKDLALNLGANGYLDESADDVVTELKKLGGADVIMNTVPDAQGALNLIEGLAFAGKILIVGLRYGTASFNPGRLVVNRWSINGFLCGTAKDCEDAVKFAKLHGIKAMVEKFPLEDAVEAFKHHDHAKFRAVIVP